MISIKKSLTLAVGAMALTGLSALANDPLSISTSQNVASFSGKDVTISGKTEVHVTDAKGLDNATVNLKGNDAWLYVDAIKPSVVLASHLKNITIDGAKADMASNIRLAQYRGGCVIIPHGYETYAKALTVYTKANCEGDSRDVAIETYHNDLGAFDNNIRSFILRKGFQVCFANNKDGTGFSRVYIADTEDLVVNDLPEGFVTADGTDKSFISFIRVCKHQWVSKKGWCGWNQNVLSFTNATHSYAWSASRPSDAEVMDREFVPQRHHDGWPGFGEINAVTNVSHLLGDNEPDNKNDPNEHYRTPSFIANMWPEYLKCGLRVGSPAPTGIWGGWLSEFFNCIDSLNYRCDYVVYHQYEATSDFKSRIDRAVEVSKGRPVWVTEWNNGANWTTESWPDASGPRRDANGNIIYYKMTKNDKNEDVEVKCSKDDEGAYTKDVSRPLTSNNATKQLNYMKEALANQDALDKLERLHFYNAVQDARAVEIDGELTPAGKYFASYNSKLAYTKKSEFEHKWKIAPPFPYFRFSEDLKTCHLSFYDHNGETGKSYTIYRRDGKSGSWNEVATLELGKDYQAGETVVYKDKVNQEDARQYYVTATSYKDTKSLKSRIVTFYRDKVEEAPELEVLVEDPYSAKLTWTPIDGAQAYKIEKRDADDAEWTIMKAAYKDGTSLTASGLTKNHDYWFRVSTVSNADQDYTSEVVKIHTPSLDSAPEAVYNLFAASGNGAVTLTWSKTYQTNWEIERADSPAGPWTSLKAGHTSTSYTDKDVVNGNTYYYRLTPKRQSLVGNASDHVSATPKEGNFIYLPFAEGKGLTANEYHSAKHATLVNGVTWTEDRHGNAKGAVATKSSKQSYVELPKSILKGVKDFTVAFWLKRGGDDGRIFDFGTGQSVSMLLDYGKNNTKGFRYKLRTSSANNNRDFNYTMEKDKWYHICLTQTSGTVTMYVNGEKIGQSSGNPNPSELGATTQNWLGRSMWDSDARPSYAYDDFFILDHASSEDEVKALMNATTAVEEIEGAVADGMTMYAVNGELTIISDTARVVNVYSINGQLVRTLSIEEGINTFSGFTPGAYIAGSHKVIL